MWTIAVAGLAAHKVRLALAAVAIVVGVSLVAGTFVLTDTIDKALTDLISQSTEGIDVIVRSDALLNSQAGGQRVAIPAGLLARVASVPGVGAAEGSVTGYAQFLTNGTQPVTNGDAPTVGVSVSTSSQFAAGVTIRAGRRPYGPDEVAVDQETARKQGLHVGDHVKILFQDGIGQFKVSGVLSVGPANNLVGTIAGFDLTTAQRVLGRENTYDEIEIIASPGMSPDTLRELVKATVGPDYDVLTARQLAAESAVAVTEFSRFINDVLLAFAFAALLVGSFIIANTFAIMISQRTRELALLRCLGAVHGQVVSAVLAEALVVGLLASLAGLALGVPVAAGLKAVFSAIGADVPADGVVIEPRTMVVAPSVGIIVTLLASLMPALRSGRVAPMVAVREHSASTATRLSGRRVAIGTAVIGIGVALLLLGLFAKPAHAVGKAGAGAVIVFLGLGVLSPLAAGPLVRLLGFPFARWAGQPGELARDNAAGNPARTASASAALMIGLALVSFVTIFAASLKASIAETIDRTVAADYILSPTNGAQGLSPDVARRLTEQPEIGAVAEEREGTVTVDSERGDLYGVDPSVYDQVVHTDTLVGSLRDLSSGGVAVREDVAKQRGWRTGDDILMHFPDGDAVPMPIRAIYLDNGPNVDYLITLTDYEQHYRKQPDRIALVRARVGVPPDVSRNAVDRVISQFPNVQVDDRAEYKLAQLHQVNRLLILFYVLLALSVILGFVGIVNTLSLWVLERVRELGVLRALGMTRRQIRSMIRWEALIIVGLGTVLGLVVGTFFGWTLVRALHNQGVTAFVIPVNALVGLTPTVALAGILAAILPARRAANVGVIRAITTE
jgi:putative ABC transport system permease protein